MTLHELIIAALKEDMPAGDLTTDSLGKSSQAGIAYLIAKQDLILSGREAFNMTFAVLDPALSVRWYFQDGAGVLEGQRICSIHGNLINVLKGERTALNFLGRLSGIATLTRCYVDRIKHTKTKILDTRKTIPCFRDLDKSAVTHGGGYNHRRDLSTAIMLKENHIELMGGITSAVAAVRIKTEKPVIVETRSLEDVREAVGLKVNRILLDNMGNEMMAAALKLIPADIETEASGNMSLERVQSVAELGVNYISVGAITHSARCADVSLLFDWTGY